LYIIKFHIVAIRYVGSTTPDEQLREDKKIRFFPDHLAKESFFVAIFVTIFFVIVFFNPDLWGIFIEPNNAIPADSLQTPETIHPPWYIGPYFAMLRCIPDLGLGLMITLVALSLWLFLTWLYKSQEQVLKAKPLQFKVMVYLFWLNFALLGVLAWFELNVWTLWSARLATAYYLLFFLYLPKLSRKRVNHA
jgi:ubiquinol-cytochrome c reductase cytochrome b subunit